MQFENAAIAAVTLIVLAALFSPRVTASRTWRAMITPLASIIGSGFLVLGPILNDSYGAWAPLMMLLLCAAAWLFGAAIRYNIAAIEAGTRPPAAERLEHLASWMLAFAYVISVAYYLNLLGAFGMRLTPWNTPYNARLLTTAIFLFILAVGWIRGFHAMERMEEYSVGLKLAVIAGMLVGLVFFFAEKVQEGGLVINPASVTGWEALTLAFGLLITVQGFETTRYLGGAYDARTRIRAMIHAQVLSTVIYVVYIALIAFVFRPGQVPFSETGIIDMMKLVAPILPYMLIVAAVAAQFSAAVADTAGAGGLFEELTRHRLRERDAYALLVAIGIALTWAANIFEIIAYASRAFALYYTVQAAIAAVTAWHEGKRAKAGMLAMLVLLGLAISLFGRAVEGG